MPTLTYKNMSYVVDGENFLVMLTAMIASTDLAPDIQKFEVDFNDPYVYSADAVHKWFTALIKQFNVRINRQMAANNGQPIERVTKDGQPFQNDFDRAYAIVRLGCELYPHLLLASVASELKTIELPGDLFLRFMTVLDEVYERRPRVRELLSAAQAVLDQNPQRIVPVNSLDEFPA